MALTPEHEIPRAPESPQIPEPTGPVSIENTTDKQEIQRLEDYLHKIENVPTQTVTDDTQQPLLTPSPPQQVTITLPMTDAQINEGLHHKVHKAARWLAAWCKRQAEKILFAQPKAE